MDLQEKILYHQIHPLKLATDIGSAILSLPLFWDHELVLSIAVAFLPPIVVSAALLSFGDFEKYKESGLGRKMKNMTPLVEGLRFAGFVVSAASAWYQNIVGVIIGLLFVGACWFYVLRKEK